MNIKKIKSERNNGIDLLKVTAMFLIILSHSVPFYGNQELPSFIDLNSSTKIIINFILIVIRNLGQQGNIIFVICSAWFLIGSNRINLKKIVNIIIDSFLISVICLIVFKLFGAPLNISLIVKSLLPILFNNNWFVGCYIILYLVHPLLNIIILNISKENYFYLLITITIMYLIIAFFAGSVYFYTPFIGFVILYFIVGYLKIYLNNFSKNHRANKLFLFSSILLMFLILLGTNIIGFYVPQLSNKMLRWAVTINPFMIVIGICLFNIFKNLKVNTKLITNISSSTLYIYMIHENILVRDIFKPIVWLYIYQLLSYKYVLLLVF